MGLWEGFCLEMVKEEETGMGDEGDFDTSVRLKISMGTVK